LDSTFFVFDSTFWLDSTLKIDPDYCIGCQSVAVFISNSVGSALTFDVYHGTAPSYITQLGRRCHDTRLRSTAREDNMVPTTPSLCRQILCSRWTKCL